MLGRSFKIVLNVLILVPLILWAAQSITLISAYSMADFDTEIQKLYAHQPHNLSERLNYFSAAFLGKKYKRGALGEGSEALFDQNPEYRTDVFDCMTYVNTVLALLNANNLTEFQQKIREINYQNSQVLYQNRYHFTSIDWNPSNQKHGFIQDITHSIHDQSNERVAKILSVYINKKEWYRKKTLADIKLLSPLTPKEAQSRLAAFRNLSEKSINQESYVPYIPLNVLFNKQGQPNLFIFEQIPSGSIIEIVRKDWNVKSYLGTDLDISHMGFAIKTPKGLVYREASSIENKVIDVSLINYLFQYVNSSEVVGINVQQILFKNY